MKGKVFLSVFTGFLFGLFGYFVLLLLDTEQAFQLSALGALLFALLLFAYLVVYGKILGKRYAKFEQEIASPIFCKANGNIRFGSGKIKNGNIYFCETEIVCVCLEDKPYTLDKLRLQDIVRLQWDTIHLSIRMKDSRVLVATLPDAKKISEVLQKKTEYSHQMIIANPAAPE